MTIDTVHVILYQIVAVGSMNLCANKDGTHDCCQGYKLDIAQDTCIPCELGFTGRNCVTKCLHPSYGQDCQSSCDCNATQMYCHHAYGCVRFSEYQIQSTTHMNLRTVTKEQMILDSNITDKGVFNIMSDNLTDFKSRICDTKKRQSKGINKFMFVIIGLTAVSFIIYMMYWYARVLESRHFNSSTV